jgi:FAD/FMN-containing dehydrogenase
LTTMPTPASAALSPSALDELAGFRGSLITPGDPRYDAARTVWNAMVDKRPAVVARCADAADVLAAVAFARRHELRAAVRGGGHNVAGNAVCDGGIVIDLSAMRGVRVDPSAATVRAEAGVTLGDLDHATHPFGLAVPAGIVTQTGLAGLTLGGGVGWLQRRYGLTIDNLLSVDLVTADGRLLTASETEHEELFWAVRGGGGNFGVVTSFEYRARPVSTVLAGALFYGPEDPAGFLHAYRDFCRDVPDELTTDALLLTAPAAPFLPEAVHGRLIGVVALCWCGEEAEGQRVLRPLRELGPVADLVAPMPFPALQRMFDEGNPPGVRHYWKSGFLPELRDDVIDALADRCARVPSPLSSIDVMLLGGAVAQVDEDATAFSHRDARFLLNITSDWTDAATDEEQRAWAREVWEAVRPATTGAGYVNYVAQEGESQAAAVYGPRKYARLREIKRAYDPENVFSLNQNIDPAGA